MRFSPKFGKGIRFSQIVHGQKVDQEVIKR